MPYYALGAELSTDYQERTRIVAWRHIIGLFGVVLATGSFWLATRDYLFPDEETGVAAVMVLVGFLPKTVVFLRFSLVFHQKHVFP